MTNFHSLRRIVDSLEVDESTRNDPIKRTFVVDGEHMTANVGVVGDCGNALHTQPDHDELLVIIDGNVNFRVGDEVQQVQDGDLVFIPKGTLHGPELEPGQKFSSLSVFAPVFDRTRDNIKWARDAD